MVKIDNHTNLLFYNTSIADIGKKPMKTQKNLPLQKVKNFYHLPLSELLFKAHLVHKKNFNPLHVQTSKLLSIKTGGCPENCAYCPQSAHHNTGLRKEKLMDLKEVIKSAKQAKEEGATRFCMGAAWREVKDGPLFDRVCEMVSEVKKLDMEVCCTLGMLTLEQAKKLKSCGLYAYNHNIDCSKNFYPRIITTRSYQDRLNTLTHVRKAGLTVCTGGIIGMGESHTDRIEFLHQLALFNPQPESVTINKLIAIPGTPLEKAPPVSALDIARVIATARLIMPKSMIRLSAGRENMNTTDQFICLFAGANSLFIGDKLLTADNSTLQDDKNLFKLLGLAAVKHPARSHML